MLRCRIAGSRASGAGDRLCTDNPVHTVDFCSVSHAEALVVETIEIVKPLARRGLIGLVLLAVLATGSLLATTRLIGEQEGAASVVNIAGRQRMLSQRIALFATRLTLNSSEQERLAARREMLTSADEFDRGHRYLSTSAASPELKRIYFDGSRSVAPLVEEYLVATRELASLQLQQPVSPDAPSLLLINAIGPTELLSSLDRAVARYEFESENAVQRAILLESVIWVVNMLVLLVVTAWIFAPMVGRLRSSIRRAAAEGIARAESEERFVLAVQGASVGIRDHYDMEKDEEYWSPQFFRLIGCEPGEMPARRASFFKLIHPEDYQRVREAKENHLRKHIPLRVECRIKHKTKGYRWYLLTGQATWSANGEPRRIITSIMDIDDRKSAEDLKSEFISNVSHELRTPLTSILGALRLMKSPAIGKLPEKVDHLTTVALDNGSRLARLINDLLDVEKMEAGKVAFDFQEENLRDLLLAVREQNAFFVQEYNATIEIKPVDPTIRVRVDKVRFAQVMSNLISNAAKHSPEGGKIAISANRHARTVRICVADEGPGIPAAFCHSVFERFSQADANGRQSRRGTGLGLSIAKAIVEAHGGSIGFDTEEGVGTTFFVDFPLAWSSREKKPAGSEAAEAGERPLKRSA
jgi:PAS domain S-box-containing protein